MNYATFKIQTVNRVGITHDIVGQLRQMDIIRMEVKPRYIYLKIDIMEQSLINKVITSIQKIIGVEKVEVINFLPSEIRENQMNTILSTVSEGIISLDHQLHIKTVNRAAEEMLDMNQKQLIDQPIRQLWKGIKKEIKRCLFEGVEILNIPTVVKTVKRGASQLILSYLPIRTKEESQGIVIVLRDMKQIHGIIQSVKETGMVPFAGIIHNSGKMKRCIEIAKRVAKSEATIFLHGESGTGKELFARAIHFESEKANGPFIPMNCAAIPETLLESELFGYEEGAFTGALKGGKKGLIEMAQGGTLFLDEVGELPYHLQAKLLRVLEERAIRRLGGHKLIPIDIRIIAATNRDISAMIEEGTFRKDLYYRLHVIPIYIPPLRERISDIPLLSDFFIKQFCHLIHRPPLSLTYQAIQFLQSYHWPGNVRELKNVIERTVYLCPDDLNELESVYLEQQSTIASCHPYDSKKSFKEKIEAYEKKLLIEILKTCKSARQAAKQIGLSHTAVLKKIKKYGLDDYYTYIS
ncbi:sigma 54-interacting transcriptional regulator [Thermoflavimicrobium daqui]|uniref:HTH-type transcriptional regulatory protein TyrR n=1 Tax=Thermoflavimicrobium daqui TaxID=2137476 RepID=A0A364K177_9BACL|nr:sigma 54-interacting transcriptional regulator [Thermoflavimicrobium daqui]RAL21436.1 hypothetical protein DL897_16470 [Thermoflavimicrobium daqui]